MRSRDELSTNHSSPGSGARHLGAGGQVAELRHRPVQQVDVLEEPDGCKILECNKNICHVLDVLTVQGVPLVGVKTGGNLRDGEEIVLVDLPLMARLLKVILRSDKNRLDYRYFDN